MGSSILVNSIFRQLRTKWLSATTTAILAVLADELPLDKLTEATDKVHVRFFQSAVNTPSGSAALDTMSERLSRLELVVSQVGRE